LSYVTATRKFTVSTSDQSLIGEIVPYSVIATLSNYPVDQYSNAPVAENGANILFDNPCNVPVSFFASTQIDADKTDKFSGIPVTFQLTQFDIDPPQCRVTYECTSVTDINGQATPMDCSKFSFDGDFDGQSTDGELSITITADDYKNDVYPIGEYYITITGTAINSDDQRSATTIFKLTLIDPCDPPVSLIAPALVNQQYTLTDPNALSYTI
jgi:hypothetical protein